MPRCQQSRRCIIVSLQSPQIKNTMWSFLFFQGISRVPSAACLGKVFWILSSVRRQTAWFKGVKILPRDGSIHKDSTLGWCWTLTASGLLGAVLRTSRVMHWVIPLRIACHFCKEWKLPAISVRGKNQENIMNWCMGESHYCVSKLPLKGQHKLQVGTQFVIWMKPVGVSLWKAQLWLHFSKVEFAAFLPNSRTRSKPFIFMACNVFFYYFFSMACNTRGAAQRDHDIQKQIKLKLY